MKAILINGSGLLRPTAKTRYAMYFKRASELNFTLNPVRWQSLYSRFPLFIMHAEVLIKEASKLFPTFRYFKDFYLVGGTALALHIGHRQSIDFDFFSQQPHLGEITSTWLEKNIPSHITRDIDEDTIHIEIE